MPTVASCSLNSISLRSVVSPEESRSLGASQVSPLSPPAPTTIPVPSLSSLGRSSAVMSKSPRGIVLTWDMVEVEIIEVSMLGSGIHDDITEPHDEMLEFIGGISVVPEDMPELREGKHVVIPELHVVMPAVLHDNPPELQDMMESTEGMPVLSWGGK